MRFRDLLGERFKKPKPVRPRGPRRRPIEDEQQELSPTDSLLTPTKDGSTDLAIAQAEISMFNAPKATATIGAPGIKGGAGVTVDRH
jgi:hypothetical protein